MKPSIWLVGALLTLALSACGGRQAEVAADIPATFTGDVLDHDQGRMEILLNLRPDGLYQLRTSIYSPAGQRLASTSRMDRWQIASAGKRLILHSRQGASLAYAVMGDDRLGYVGTGAGSMGRHELWRLDTLAPFADTVRLRGLYQESAQQRVLRECTSGRVFPVSKSGQANQIISAYRAEGVLGEPLLVVLQGRLVEQIQGGGEEIVVVEVEQLTPNLDCDGQTRVSLIGTRWQLATLAGEPVVFEASGRSPFLVLEREHRRMQAFAGCNHVTGTYRVEYDSVVIDRHAATRMACADGTLWENRFLVMLDRVARFQVQGAGLSLFDSAGGLLATFIAMD